VAEVPGHAALMGQLPARAAARQVPLGKKNAAKRPETKEGGREEEKSRLGIASRTGVRTASQQQKLGVLPLGGMDSPDSGAVPSRLRQSW